MSKGLLILVLVLLCSSVQSRSWRSQCDQLSNTVIEPILNSMVTNYTENKIDVFYTETVLLSQLFPYFSEVCHYKLPEIDENLLSESSPLECGQSLKDMYVYAKQQSGRALIMESQTFYPFLIQFVNECQPFKFRGLFKPTPSILAAKPAMKCAACALLVTMIENYINFHKVEISEAIAQKIICKNLSQPMKTTCELSVELIGPQVIEQGVTVLNSDVICNKLNMCVGFTQCKLHPNSTYTYSREFLDQIQQPFNDVTPWDYILDLIKRFADYHVPLIDLDNDTFSQFPTFRGYDWRGYDCNDSDPNVYPGRKSASNSTDPNVDYNCNGIYGLDPATNKTYKELYCDGQDYQGTILIGDSAGAHFSIPAEWIDSTLWHKGVFKGFFPKLSNELDLPHKSSGTGWVKEALVDSQYIQNIKKNRCVRGDYQNLGVNGARSSNDMKNLLLALKRDQQLDYPVTLQFELIGNDVCNGHAGFSHMTTPENFRKNILELWNFIDTKLPAGSRMIVTGLANGSVLYDTLADKIGPLKVPYPVFYDFLNCLEISPCWGWMNSDKAARDGTTARAMELNKVYIELISTTKFKNFEALYLDVPMEEVFKRANQMGFTNQDCIEPVDGFHPSQLTNYLITQIDGEKVAALKPGWVLKENPNNKLIDQKFPHMKPYPDI